MTTRIVWLAGQPRDRVRALGCAGAKPELENPPVVQDLKTRARSLVDDERSWIGLFIITAVVATVICVARVCNNFLIFRAAFDHLVVGADMYILHPAEHGDLFK